MPMVLPEVSDRLVFCVPPNDWELPLLVPQLVLSPSVLACEVPPFSPQLVEELLLPLEPPLLLPSFLVSVVLEFLPPPLFSPSFSL